MDLAVKGLSNKEIARNLQISPRTVETYRARFGITLTPTAPFAAVLA